MKIRHLGVVFRESMTTNKSQQLISESYIPSCEYNDKQGAILFAVMMGTARLG